MVAPSFSQAVHAIVQRVPTGRVISYGDVALAVGRPGAARAVGQVMRRNPDTDVTPCHRVVAADGTLGGYMGSVGQELEAKVARLRREGVPVLEGRIARFHEVRWRP